MIGGIVLAMGLVVLASVVDAFWPPHYLTLKGIVYIELALLGAVLGELTWKLLRR
jgi:hypothetical protein